MRSPSPTTSILILAACGAMAAACQPAALTARAALDRGLVAAKSSSWREAVRYFSAAQEQAYLAPSVLFNLGLAHGRAGSDVLGASWLHAYLAAAPQAANATAVRTEIQRLERSAGDRLQRLLRHAASAAELLPVQGETPTSEGHRAKAMSQVARIHFLIGDNAVGEAVYRRFKEQSSSSYLEDGWLRRQMHAEFLAEHGDAEGARRLLAELPKASRADQYDSLHSAIGSAFLAKGSHWDALSALDSIKGDIYPFGLRHSLMLFLAEKGDFAFARTLCQTNKTADERASAGASLASVLLAKGRADEALRVARDNSSPMARWLAGDAEPAIQTLLAQEPSAFHVWGVEAALYSLTYGLLLAGHRAYAARAASAARVKAPPARQGGMRHARAAEAMLAVAAGDAEGAAAAIREASHFAEAHKDTPEEKQSARRSTERFFRKDAVRLALALGDHRTGERLATLSLDRRINRGLLDEVRQAVEKKGLAAPLASVREQLALQDIEAWLGWKETRGPEAKVTAWIELAEKLSEQGAIANLQTQLAEVKARAPPDVPRYLAEAARALAGGMVRLRVQRESAR